MSLYVNSKTLTPIVVRENDSTSLNGPERHGGTTFEAEGTDQKGRFYSRIIHWPGGSSGVTIGRGYDLGKRSAMEVISDLSKVGVPLETIALLARASGKTGPIARNFVRDNKDTIPEISPEAEEKLFFDLLYPRYVADTRRIFDSEAVQSTYGSRQWKNLPRKVQELFVDLRYRGDYSPKTRPYIQRLAVNGDYAGLLEVMKNKELWTGFGVPEDRQRRRIELLASLIKR